MTPVLITFSHGKTGQPQRLDAADAARALGALAGSLLALDGADDMLAAAAEAPVAEAAAEAPDARACPI